ncbi:MAG: TRAP transporter substrate-binding protein [Betaproteobacteria bacterium]|nr:TRAP transporter substrate-binding protein [Betaproteobacteria bacterium]
MRGERGTTGALAIALCMSLASACALAQQPIKWKMMTLWPAGSLPQKINEEFAEKVKQKSGGRLVIEVHSGGAIVQPQESLDALSAGVLDIQNASPGYATGKDAAFALLGDLQGGWETPQQSMDWLHKGGGLELVRALYKKYNAHFVGGAWYGMESLVSKKPLRTLADFKGLKLRAPTGMGQDIWRILGAAPVNLPGSEVYTALERGVVDASDWGTLSMNQDLGYHKLAKYPSYPGFHSMPMSDVAVNMKRWNALPDDLKRIVETATEEFNQDMIRRNAEADGKVAKEATQLGVETVSLLPADRFKFREIAMGVWAQFAGRSEMAKKIYDSQLAYLRKLGLVR